MGSKSKIAEQVCRLFPKADNFYDLFGGGFAITHCMVKTRKNDFKTFHYNELRDGLPQIIQDCIDGKFNDKVYKMPWVSREEFFKRKDEDYFINIIWSFGNNGEKWYIFAKDIEQQKKSLHMAIVFGEFDDFAKEVFGFDKFREGYSIYDKRIFLKRRLEQLKKGRCDLQQLQQLQQLERLQQLQQLQRLQQLERLQQNRLSFYNGDYRKVEIKENSVVYCDIPYESTAEYDNNSGFNHKEFYEWARELKHPLFVSEYNINQDFLKLIFNENVRSTLSSTSNSTKRSEKVYCNKLALDLIKEQRSVKAKS